MRSNHNQAAVAILLRWAQASEESNHTSQAPKTFRRAAKSLREYPDPVTTRAEALAVKFIGDKLADSLQGCFDIQQRAPARRVAMLRHEEEGKWWSVSVAGEMAQRSWGKRSATGLEGPGMDNFEQLMDERAALHWACQKVAKQLAKGYSHAPGSQAQFDGACTDSGGPPAAAGRARGRAVGGDAAAAVPPAAAGAVPPAPVPPTAAIAVAAAAAPEAAAARPARPAAQRAYSPRLLDARGEVSARGGSLRPPLHLFPSPPFPPLVPVPQSQPRTLLEAGRRRGCAAGGDAPRARRGGRGALPGGAAAPRAAALPRAPAGGAAGAAWRAPGGRDR